MAKPKNQLSSKNTQFYIFLIFLGVVIAASSRTMGQLRLIDAYIFWFFSQFVADHVLNLTALVVGLAIVALGVYGLFKKVSFKSLPKYIQVLTLVLLISLSIMLAVSVLIRILFQSYTF